MCVCACMGASVHNRKSAGPTLTTTKKAAIFLLICDLEAEYDG